MHQPTRSPTPQPHISVVGAQSVPFRGNLRNGACAAIKNERASLGHPRVLNNFLHTRGGFIFTLWYYLETSSNGLKDFLKCLDSTRAACSPAERVLFCRLRLCSTQVQNCGAGDDSQPIARLPCRQIDAARPVR